MEPNALYSSWKLGRDILKPDELGNFMRDVNAGEMNRGHRQKSLLGEDSRLTAMRQAEYTPRQALENVYSEFPIDNSASIRSKLSDALRGFGDSRDVATHARNQAQSQFGTEKEQQEWKDDYFSRKAGDLFLKQIPRTLGHAIQGDFPNSESYRRRKQFVELVKDHGMVPYYGD